MIISGKEIANRMREDLKREIENLKSREITPKIAIITLGPEGAWETYVRQKLKIAAELGITAELINLADATEAELLKKIEEINLNPEYHGVIVQRPMPSTISRENVTNAIAPNKDVDGFRDDSPFEVPVWLAAQRLIAESINQLELMQPWQELKFVVVGKGETAGGPTIEGLRSMGIEPSVIDSKTENPGEILKNADVVITSTGKSSVINAKDLKPGVIVIGIGTHTEDNKLKGDFTEEEVEKVAGSFTPTPGGVGPVNLAFLFRNLIDATKQINS